MAKTPEQVLMKVDGQEVAISNPNKVLFPTPGITKLDLAQYYATVAEGALRGAGGRPNVLVRYPNGVGGEFFFQKRAPASRRAREDARVSAPVTWDELAHCDPADFTLRSMPERYRVLGDLHAGIDVNPQSLEPLLEPEQGPLDPDFTPDFGQLGPQSPERSTPRRPSRARKGS
jgi:DNA primase